MYENPAPWNDPKNALAFLKRDLAEKVGQSDRPVILFWHYGLRGWGLEKWWTEEDLTTLKSAPASYNVALILHGHEHRYERYEWAGYDVVMGPAPYSPGENPEEASEPKGFLVFRVTEDSLQMAHHNARGWEQTWAKALPSNTPTNPEPAAAESLSGR